jgi:pyrroloquinoline-quinone synthase
MPAFMDRVAALDAVRERWNVLRHPFYQRWSAGELTAEELAWYAGEYRHAVVALAEASAAAARDADPATREELLEHAEQEAAHVGLWDRFASEVEADCERAPAPESERCAAAWTAGGDLLERLAVLYAIEGNQPAVSRTKLEGLVEHYGVAPDAPASAYFVLHAELDHEHAEQSRALLEERAADADLDRLLRVAEGALRGNWELLDGVERHFGRDPA